MYYSNKTLYKNQKEIPKKDREDIETLKFGEDSYYLSMTNKETKNSKEDVDFKLISIFSFLNLLKKGDFSCMELLYAPKSKILIKEQEFDELIKQRQSLLLKDTTSFLGFVRGEFKRNGYNHKSYSNLLELKDFLLKTKERKLKTVFSDLEVFAKGKDYISFKVLRNGLNSVCVYQSFFEETVSVSYVTDWIDNKTDMSSYRRKTKSQKGLYHSLRLIYEVLDLLKTGEFIIPYPKDRIKILLDIKENRISFDDSLDLVNKGVEKVYEMRYNTNKKNVCDKIDKIYFMIKGRVELGRYE